MNLQTLGLDDWFRERAGDLLREGLGLARVTTVDRNACVVRNEHGETVAELSGALRFSAGSDANLPCVGDWVCVQQASPDLAIIHAVLPRKTFLRRKSPGKTVDFQMMATNVDLAFIVQSCHFDFNLRRLDRYLVVAREGNIEPVVILTKTDLVSPDDLDGMIADIRRAGIQAQLLPISNTTGSGLDELRALLVPGRTFCLLGSSGVGKTTLINRLLGEDSLETRTVSATGEGVHTTTRRQLLVLDNGAMLIDTPGMRELGLLGAGEGVESSFADIQELSQECRFADCTHAGEPGCAVRKALDCGDLDPDRYASYEKLRKETDHHDRSYVEKRKKDKEFGKLIKSVMKHKKR